eukprot:scaffold125932_cov44-Tisochrysis_lutea.AAC.2
MRRSIEVVALCTQVFTRMGGADIKCMLGANWRIGIGRWAGYGYGYGSYAAVTNWADPLWV